MWVDNFVCIGTFLILLVENQRVFGLAFVGNFLTMLDKNKRVFGLTVSLREIETTVFDPASVFLSTHR